MGDATDAPTLADGRNLLVHNHTGRGRSPLNLAVSVDGKAWRAALALEDEPGGFSYPASIQSTDGLVQVTYTWNRKKIRHATLDPSKLVLRDIEGGRWPGPGPPPAASEGVSPSIPEILPQ